MAVPAGPAPEALQRLEEFEQRVLVRFAQIRSIKMAAVAVANRGGVVGVDASLGQLAHEFRVVLDETKQQSGQRRIEIEARQRLHVARYEAR